MSRTLRSCLLVAALLLSADAFARAGGGEHSSSGGSSSSSSSSHRSSSSSSSRSRSSGSSSGGSADGDTVAIVIVVLFGLFFIVAIAPVIARKVRGKDTKEKGARRAKKKSPKVRSEPVSLAPDGDVAEKLAALRQADPAFDPAAFQARAGRVFVAVQEAWFRRDYTQVRHLMSDGVYRRFLALQRLMQAEGRRDALADCGVVATDLVSVSRSATFDVVTLVIQGALRDEEVDAKLSDDAARAVAKKAKREVFEEFWTFARRQGAHAKHDASTGACPNCGAAYLGGAANRCTHCQAIVNSGTYDWVLTEITQPSSGRPSSGTRALDGLVARDPDAAAEVLEDRALLLFWKWVEATALGRAAVLRPVTRPEAFARLTAALAPTEEPRLRKPVVGAADVLGADVIDGFDRVHVRVRWSAEDPGEDATPREDVVVFVRRRDAKTDRTFGLANDRCHACGAPVTDADAPTCAYCAGDLVSGAQEWVLEDVVPRAKWKRPVAA